uniref:GINS complex subunit 2 n=1 Tax=Hucho hucho TaxID=62062 RepID=A0A4W5QWK8_9TELE
MDPSEVEFLAEKEAVKIIPNFSLDKIYLIGVSWLTATCRQRQKCRIVPPEWMDVGKLRRQVGRKTFTPVPSPYYMELTKLLLSHASDNIPKADEIRTLVKDIWDTRIAKLRLSADSFISQQEAHAKLDNLTLMELNTTRSFLLDTLNCMYKLPQDH